MLNDIAHLPLPLMHTTDQHSESDLQKRPLPGRMLQTFVQCVYMCLCLHYTAVNNLDSPTTATVLHSVSGPTIYMYIHNMFIC